MRLGTAELDTPIGALTLVFRDGRLCAAAFEDHRPKLEAELTRRFGSIALEPGAPDRETLRRIADYLAGDLGALDTIPVDAGGTGFQRRVWSALREIPAGETVSYGELARTLGRPSAARAVGLANGANPIPVVIPCHRVIASDGGLGGYGGGLDRKRWLLRHEGVKRATRPVSRRLF